MVHAVSVCFDLLYIVVLWGGFLCCVYFQFDLFVGLRGCFGLHVTT